MLLFSATYDSPLGLMVLSSDGKSLSGVRFVGQKYFPVTHMERREGLPAFNAAREWLDSYFAGGRPDPRALPLAPEGTDFRRLIWDLLLDIPYGETTTYGALAAQAARRLDRPAMSAQAVGSAVGHNPISVIIPCHRVVGADGQLIGYAAGISAKHWLLRHEGAIS